MYGMNRGLYGGSGMYGGGMGGGLYGGMGGMGGGMYGAGGGMYGMQPGMGGPMNGPYDPNQPPPAPPTAWQTMLAGINGIMMFFGRLSFLVDENAHAVHFFISALLQLLDRAGSLYAEVARFVLRILFRRRAPKKVAAAAGGPPAQPGLPAPPRPGLPMPMPGGLPPAGNWDGLWGH